MSSPAIQTPIPGGGIGLSAIGQQEIDAVTQILKTPEKLFRYQGAEKSQCDLLEQELCAKTGAKHALFISSGTSALSCCLAALEIGPGDEVIVPAYTYIATAAAVVDVGAVPVLAEIDNSLGLDPADVERKITPYTKAIIVVHMMSVPAKLDALHHIARRHGLKVVEDCCQAIGTTYRGKYCGMESDAWAWSTNYYKNITSMEGGVFFANDDTVFQKGLFQSDPALQMWGSPLAETGEIPPFSRAGYRGNEICAAIARVQLGKLDGMLQKTRSLKKTLLSHLNPPVHYTLQEVDDPEGDCGISCAFIANSQEEAKRLSEELKAEGLTIGSIYNGSIPDRHIYSNWTSILNKNGATPLGYPWKDPAYRGNVEYSPTCCPNTLDILARCLRLSININMSEQNMLEIAQAINNADARL